ncbi:hypothetical protein FRC12_018839 [Ceratobasidium sp. 428]|nr:hypothetical protein FRC12_018839 [Ceratobasidium sp. 428]
MRFTSTALIAAAILASDALAQQGNWGTCGGIGWPGPTTCNPGWVCYFWNIYDSTCIPASQASTMSYTPPPTARPTA